MKRIILTSSLAVSIAGQAMAATETPASHATVVAKYITGRGPHHRDCQVVIAQTNETGQVCIRTNSYTELATGMSYLENSEWRESRELIEPFEGGAVARYGPHKVIFAENLNTAGAIDLETPDAKRMRSHVTGLSYLDTASGKSVWLAEVKDCRGQIVRSNQVLYSDAFAGVKADVRYTYTKAGFEQDVILRMQPPSPEKFGLNPDTTRLQVLTEFLRPPVPAKTERSFTTSNGETLRDEGLNFGEMAIGSGRAFALGREDEPAAPVGKRWQKLEGRDFLIEEVAVPDLANELKSLPETASVGSPGKQVRLAKLDRELPAARQIAAKAAKMLFAKIAPQQPGVVLDYYETLTSHANYTLRGDTTYYVSSFVIFSGTTTIEGGAVIKHSPASSARLILNGPVVCRTGPYRPAIFTARDDDIEFRIKNGYIAQTVA